MGVLAVHDIIKVRFVIWGAGTRGRRILSFLSKDRIDAFIDSNSQKWGEFIDDIPVISFDAYMEKYNKDIIIISPLHDFSIEKFLLANNVHNFVLFNDAPTEMTIKEDISFFSLIFNKYANCNMMIGLFGINLYSILLYEYFICNGYNKICFVDGDVEKVNFIREFYYCVCQDDKLDCLLVTNRDIDLAIKQYAYLPIYDCWDLSVNLIKQNNENLLKFKNLHVGKELFIVATGPSLTFDDLDKIEKSNIYSMSVNTIFRGFNRTTWRPKYYVMDDTCGIKEYHNDINLLNELEAVFLPQLSKHFFNGDISEKIFFYNAVIDHMSGCPRFSDDISKRIYSSATVMYSALQIAIYMGFSKIYLIGADTNYESVTANENNHFIKDYFSADDEYAKKTVFSQIGAFQAYQSVKLYADRHDIEIYNATRGGKLEVFKRIDFDSLFD